MTEPGAAPLAFLPIGARFANSLSIAMPSSLCSHASSSGSEDLEKLGSAVCCFNGVWAESARTGGRKMAQAGEERRSWGKSIKDIVLLIMEYGCQLGKQ